MTEEHKAKVRENGRKGGRPTTELTELRKKAREDAQRMLAEAQTRAVQFLIQVMDDETVNTRDRLHCATELLDRGELPKKSAAYHGVGELTELDAIFGSPKLFVTGKYGTEAADTNLSTNDQQH